MIESLKLRKNLSYCQARRLADSLYERFGESTRLAFIPVKEPLGYSVRVVFDGTSSQQANDAIAVYDMLRYSCEEEEICRSH